MQERAARTRALVVRAAAALFARDGYDGVTYRQIAAAAKVSVGSLTFHFESKSELADTIEAEGTEAARHAVERIAAQGGSALQQAFDITVELTRLLEEDVCAWAALRLVRERQGPGRWSELWLPTVHALLVRAQAAGQLRASARADDVAALVEHLVGGTEAYLRDRTGTEQEHEDAVARLQRIWRIALEGISPHASEGTSPRTASASLASPASPASSCPQSVPAPRPPREADAPA